MTPYRLLNTFEDLFSGKPYRHRVSNQNDYICVQLFEDLLALGKSPKLVSRIGSRQWVVNTKNKAFAVKARRGDGTFGELVPGEEPTNEPSYAVGRGLIATVEIGVECKVLAKAMIKQIDRVMNDLREQVASFERGTGSKPITVAIVGVNYADHTVGYEGDRAWPTGWIERRDPVTGHTKRQYHKHPFEEADEAVRRLDRDVRPHYDEMIVLRYKATNESPFPFSWVDQQETIRAYATMLTKVSREYEHRF